MSRVVKLCSLHQIWPKSNNPRRRYLWFSTCSPSWRHAVTFDPLTLSVCCRLGDWVELGLTSHQSDQTHYRSHQERVFYRSNDPTNSVKALKKAGMVHSVSWAP